MANAIFNSFKTELMGGIDLEGVTIKAMLVDETYVADMNIDTHTRRSDVQAYEVSGDGYTAGGKTLENVSVSQDSTADAAVFDADDVTWQSATITTRGAILYISTGNAANDNLIGFVDFGSNKIADEGDLTIQWNADGIFRLA